MVNTRIKRLAEDVTTLTFPRVEFKTTVSVTSSDGEHQIQVWIVDGEFVRTYVDKPERIFDAQFSNFGQHYMFDYIPEFEFWIDKEAGDDESKYYIEHLKVEWAAMRDGKPYEEAIVEADNVERSLRRQDADLNKVIDPVTRRVDPKKFRTRLIKALDNGNEVWAVDGDLVRTFLFTDFVAGGHGMVYSWIPPGEIWIDDDVSWHERGIIILHELNEFNLMCQGWNYSKAHNNSLILEDHCRRNPDELHDALINVGWN